MDNLHAWKGCPVEPTNSVSTPPQKKRKVVDKPLNLDQNGVFRFPITAEDHRQLKLIEEVLDVSFKSSGQEAISPELHRPDDCVNAIKEAEKLLSLPGLLGSLEAALSVSLVTLPPIYVSLQ